MISLRHCQNILCRALVETIIGIVQTVKLASLDGGVTSQTTAAGDSGAALPTESMRCPGPVAIAGIREGLLWLIDVQGSPFMIPLSHPGIRARAAAAQGEAESAATIAENGECQSRLLQALEAAKISSNIPFSLPGQVLETDEELLEICQASRFMQVWQRATTARWLTLLRPWSQEMALRQGCHCLALACKKSWC